jgi:hypothetical protein
MRQASWRFALGRGQLIANAFTIPGFSFGFNYPANWVRTHKLFVAGADGREFPIDVRERPAGIFANVSSLWIENVSSVYSDPSAFPWPESFAQAVAAYLAFSVAERVTGEPNAAGRMSTLFAQFLEQAKEIDAEPEDRWLGFQRNGEMVRGARDLLRHAPWRFATLNAAISVTAGTPAPGFSFAFAKPADWLQTQKLFYTTSDGREYPFDIREHALQWSTNRSSFSLRYTSSTLGLDSAKWDEPFRTALLAYLEAGRPQMPTQGGEKPDVPGWYQAVLLAQSLLADPPDPWLSYQRSGEMLRGARDLLRHAAWRFALRRQAITVNAGAADPGFSSSFAFPSDHLKTHRLFFQRTDGRESPFDIRERNFHWSTDKTAFHAHYVSSEYGLDVLRWEEPFRTALLAYLEAGRPQMPAEGQTREEAPGWYQAVLLAKSLLAEPDDFWLPYQLSGDFNSGVLEVTSDGVWRFTVATAPLSGSFTPPSGFKTGFAKPDKYSYAVALYQVSSDPVVGRCPVDVREENAGFYVNAASTSSVILRFVSREHALDVNDWPDVFIDTLRSWLVWRAAPAGEEKAAALAVYRSQRDAALALHGDTPDIWWPFQQSGIFARVAKDMHDRAFWRFAMRLGVEYGESDSSAVSDVGGYTRTVTIPSDWTRTRALYTLNVEGERRPVDIREQGDKWYASSFPFYADYASDTLGMDARLWPGPYLRAVHAGCVLEAATAETLEPAAAAAALTFEAALQAYADPPDPWLTHQLSGAFAIHVPAVMARGNWWWALVEQQYSALADQISEDPSYGFPYRYPLPNDWFKTHALFVPWDGQECPINIRETGADWSTDAETFVARYVSRAALDPLQWPQAVVAAVYGFLEWQTASSEERNLKNGEFDLLFGEALRWSRPDNEWLRFQLNGSYQPIVKRELERGRWRFALRDATLTETDDPLPAELSTGDPEYSFAYRFIWPNDLLRTVRVYYERGAGPHLSRADIPFAEIGGAYHANITPVKVRYVSRLGLDSTKWTAHFRDAVLARAQYEEVRNNPAMTQIAAAKLALYKDAIKEAERLDDARDRTVIRGSRFVAGRYGRSRLAEPYDYIPTAIGGPPTVD